MIALEQAEYVRIHRGVYQDQIGRVIKIVNYQGIDWFIVRIKGKRVVDLAFERDDIEATDRRMSCVLRWWLYLVSAAAGMARLPVNLINCIRR